MVERRRPRLPHLETRRVGVKGLTEEAGKVANTAVTAMSGAPLAIALLVVNVGFLGFSGYILGEVAENARERNQAQLQLVSSLVNDIRDCRQGPKP
jgi:hypothetical protein